MKLNQRGLDIPAYLPGPNLLWGQLCAYHGAIARRRDRGRLG
jgi:hypothetical protein